MSTLNVLLAKPDGSVLHGDIENSMIAATPVMLH
ncbi:hypothetical protein L195_g035068 [Trifolium pratense]|uniref:Uncharacterized protein n=1 Tax=Trifolium pratense TaxID=57577 RepID=A0A2K3LKM2_TRIPR|nr:hypothetical protein L195_g035068 [Trifolium pratense]